MYDNSGIDWYILKDDHSVKKVSLKEWEKWREDDSNRRVDFTSVGEVNISTVFLLAAIDLQHIFETMVFGGPLDQEMARYATWDEASDGHQEMVARVRSTRKED